MSNKSLLIVAILGVAAPHAGGQQIRITIPRHSQLTPVQRFNREGVEEVVRHKYEKAESLFYKAYLFDPADPFTLNNLGYVSELQGQIDRAADYYKLAMEQGCDAIVDRSSDKKLKGRPMMDALGTIKDVPMRINRTNIYAIQLISQNRGVEAQTLLQQLLPLDPRNAFTLNNLAVAEESVGDLEDALIHYDAAAATRSMLPVVVSLKPSSRGKPISFLASGAGTELRARMAKMDIRQVRAHMYAVRGVNAVNRNDFGAARKEFEKSFSEDPQSAFALNNLGYVAEADGDLETAMSYYARAQRAPDSSDAVGMASQAVARGKHLASVARVSHNEVGVALNSQTQGAPPSSQPVELLRRDGSADPSVEVPERTRDQPAADTPTDNSAAAPAQVPPVS